jgi:hypothetical protein
MSCSALFIERDGPVSKKEDHNERQLVGFLGVGLDNRDEHQRITRAEHFFLIGGSAETHERMQDTAIRFKEALDKKGKALKETTPEEAIDLLQEAMETGG